MKIMSTKGRCLQCGKRLEKDFPIIRAKDGSKMCSNWCKDDWELDTK